jgi:Arc/MetJ-type ribon-helix-helix transcriptional regulator
MGDRKPQINIALDEGQKQKWKNRVEEEGEYSSLSQLIRTSVERELSGRHDSNRDGKQIAKLVEKVGKLENQINALSGDLGEMRGIVESQQPSFSHLKSEAFAVLPDGDMASPMSPEEVASEIGGPVDAETMEDVLDELAASTGQVRAVYTDESGEQIPKFRKKGDKI